MRAVLGYAPGSDARQLRQVLLGAGLKCLPEDCVVRGELAARLARSDTELVVVETGEGMDWRGLEEAIQLTKAPVLAIGPTGAEGLAKRAREAGALDYLNEAGLRDTLDAVLDRIMKTDESTESGRKRGTVISVFAPTPGSGGSTVAANLAGALSKEHPQEVALVELAREYGDLAALLNLDSPQTVREVCQRWETLDTTSLAHCFAEHPSGLRVLIGPEEQPEGRFLHPESVRRLAVLSRIVFGHTVFALESRLSPEAVEVMRLSDAVVLVVRADVPAVRRARWALDCAVSKGVPHERFHLVVNRWGQGGQLKLKQVEESLGLKVCQQIQDDPTRVNKAANRGILLRELAPRRSICREFKRLAWALNGK